MKLIRLPEVLSRLGVSRSQIYLMMDRGEFGRPVKISARACGWPEVEVDAFIRSRIEAREAA
jgi:prophage regulatory protein